MVANLHFQLSWYNQITLLPPLMQHHSFFRNFHPLFICLLHCWVCLVGTEWWSQLIFEGITAIVLELRWLNEGAGSSFVVYIGNRCDVVHVEAHWDMWMVFKKGFWQERLLWVWEHLYDLWFPGETSNHLQLDSGSMHRSLLWRCLRLCTAWGRQIDGTAVYSCYILEPPLKFGVNTAV